MTALIVCAAVLAAALYAAGLATPWLWRELCDLGPQGDGRHRADPLAREAPAVPPPAARLPALFLAAPVAPPPVCETPGCWRWDGHDGECGAPAVATEPAAELSSVAAYASALKAAAAEREAAEAAAFAEAQARQAELRAEAKATSPWEHVTGEWPALMADLEEYGATLEQAGDAA